MTKAKAMKTSERKAATAAYKERKAAIGIYAVRCLTSGQCWAGRGLDLGTVRNRLWFTLRQGGHLQASLQQAWRDHGADAFSFEVVEQLKDEDQPASLRDRELKSRLDHWVGILDARPI